MKTVLCHGCFDVLHAGHLKHFQAAKKYGDYLIVSITTDRFVNKGPGRPYFSVERRAEMLRAMGIVDDVVVSDEATAIGAIQRIKPDFYVKGPDYKDFSKDVTGEIINEKKAVESYGGQLVFTDEETFSSSAIINRHFQPWSDEQKAQIEKIQSLGGIERIEKAIGEIAKLKVLVVGEPITDIYRFVQAEGISSKSPTVSARFQYEEEYSGGSWAIFNHIQGFTAGATVWPHGPLPQMPTKIRYISSDKQQRIFEVTHINDATHPSEKDAGNILKLAEKSDVVIAADFGHGLFEGPVLGAMESITCFVGLNVQTNSSNFGFNVYTKHKRFDYLCLDTREARLAMHDRYSKPLDIANAIYLEQDMKRPISITLGSNGSCLFMDSREITSPAFSDVVIDATGAGDAYFSITTCLIATGCQPELIPFIGNVFAGLKTKIIGNKSSVSKSSLLKACAGILK